MSNLITAAEFAGFRNVSQKLDTKKIEEAILLAQQSDLLEALGDFYFDVLKNKDEASYQDLMDGSEFEYSGNVFEQSGVKRLLADYAYARYMYTVNVNVTPFGAQRKTTQDSESVDRNTLKDLAKIAQQDAGIKMKFIDLYLRENSTIFERYCINNDYKGYLSDKISGNSFNSNKFDVI